MSPRAPTKRIGSVSCQIRTCRPLRDSGYLTLSVPKEYGGHGLPLLDCIAAQLELAQGSASTAMVAGMNMQIFGNGSEQRRWPAAIFEQMCRASVQDGALFNTVASEPQLGSPSRGGMFATRAERSGESWIINGHKNVVYRRQTFDAFGWSSSRWTIQPRLDPRPQ